MEIGNPRRIKMSSCPSCGEKLDGASQLAGNTLPTPGCVSICAMCANISIFDDEMNLRFPTDEEKQEIENLEVVKVAQKAIREAHQVHRKIH